jgi:hypothetical protein
MKLQQPLYPPTGDWLISDKRREYEGMIPDADISEEFDRQGVADLLSERAFDVTALAKAALEAAAVQTAA